MKTADLPVSFWQRVERPAAGCWTWTGACNRAGYGMVRVDRRTELAHRISYELSVGPVAAGLEVCHRCDNPPCVNPDHLFMGTRQDNESDKKLKGRTSNAGIKNPPAHCPRGHEYNDVNTRWHGRTRYCRACQRERWREKHGRAV